MLPVTSLLPRRAGARDSVRLTPAGSTALIAALLALGAAPVHAQDCPAGALASDKSAALYLYFPTSEDMGFPSFDGEPTSPLAAFDITDYDSDLSTSDIRQRALELVQAGYCEFDVEVKLSTSDPSPTESRWQIVGVGSDDNPGLVGLAQDVDTGDSDAQDYARIWMGALEGFAGGELDGSNSTQERWSVAIANLLAHESAHNYGAQHSEAAPRTGEDPAANHFIADPATGATSSSITDSYSHFSDAVYERFGHDIGLNIKTLTNWDFVNPNSSDADRLQITLLSSASSLTIGWFYTGNRSPWTNPTVTKRSGTLTFRGTTYNVFDLEFDDPTSWAGGPDGVAPPGVEFHVGASFTEADPVIVYETLLSNGGSDLPLKPRIFGFDAGVTSSGAFTLSMMNTQEEDAGFLDISDVRVRFLPRMLDINQMVRGGELQGVHGREIRPFDRQPGGEDVGLEDADRSLAARQEPVRLGEEPLELEIAHLTDRRHLDTVVVRDPDCEPGQVEEPAFGDPSYRYCPKSGNVLSLFPATFTYVSATVTDPDARQWDPDAGEFVEGPLSTRVFFQLAGTVPDANENGIDDLVDIRDGTSADRDGNGIPDEAQEAEEEERRIPLWVILLAALLVLVLLVWWWWHRRP